MPDFDNNTLETRSGKGYDWNSARPQWKRSRIIEGEDFYALQTALEDGIKHAARIRTFQDGKTTEEMTRWFSRLVVYKQKKTGRTTSVVFTIIPEIEWFKRNKNSVSHLNFNDLKDFTGVVLFSSPQGKMLTGKRYKDGKITHRLKRKDKEKRHQHNELDSTNNRFELCLHGIYRPLLTRYNGDECSHGNFYAYCTTCEEEWESSDVELVYCKNCGKYSEDCNCICDLCGSDGFPHEESCPRYEEEEEEEKCSNCNQLYCACCRYCGEYRGHASYCSVFGSGGSNPGGGLGGGGSNPPSGEDNGNTTGGGGGGYSDAYYTNLGQQGINKMINALESGNYQISELKKTPTGEVILNALGIGINTYGIPIACISFLKDAGALAESFGRSVSLAGVAVGVSQTYIAFTDGNISASDIATAVSTLLGGMGYVCSFLPGQFQVATGVFGLASCTVGLVATFLPNKAPMLIEATAKNGSKIYIYIA